MTEIANPSPCRPFERGVLMTRYPDGIILLLMASGVTSGIHVLETARASSHLPFMVRGISAVL